MPLYTNIGGKLIEIKSLNTTTGDILKPIYGTPKENMKFHWGGFTGESNESEMLIGTITLNCPTYVSVLMEIPDNTASTLFTTPTDQMIVNGRSEITDIGNINTNTYDYKLTYKEYSKICFNNDYWYLLNEKSHVRTFDGWALEQDYVKNTELIPPILMNNNTNTNEYEVKVARCSYYIVYRREKGDNYWSSSDSNIIYFPMDGMKADFTFTFQTLNNG